MKYFVLVTFFTFLIFSQTTSAANSSLFEIPTVGVLSDTEKIITEISAIFERSIKASENLDTEEIYKFVNDSLKAGFLDNGVYFNSFDLLFIGLRNAIVNVKHQQITLENKKITVLSENTVLLTASGNASVELVDGRIVNRNFTWSFIYLKIKNEWKVIHSHMSNPR